MDDKESLKKEDGKKRSLQNLKPIKPGEVRNPKGRPKKAICIPDILRRMGDEPSEYRLRDDGTPMTRLEAALDFVFQKAEGGDLNAVEFIANRTEGKALERMRINDDKDELVIIGRKDE